MLCLTAGAMSAVVAVSSFTLAWTHSIEKTRWEEDWRIEAGRLLIVEARIRGSGAGMEPPPDAVLREGVWHYQPALPAQTVLRLRHTPHAAGYELCQREVCRPLAQYLPEVDNHALIEVRSCP